MANNINITNSIDNFFKSYNKGTFGLYAGTISDLKMNKYPVGTPRSEYKNTTPNPYLNRKVETYAVWKNAATGVSYYAIVKGECEREGIEFTDEEFAQAFPHEETYAKSDDNILFTHRNDDTRRYLRLYKGRNPTKVVYFTFLDGQLVKKGSDTYNDIMQYVPNKPETPSAKQEALGITNIVEVRQYKETGVVFLSQGDKMYISPDYQGNKPDMEYIKGLFQ